MRCLATWGLFLYLYIFQNWLTNRLTSRHIINMMVQLMKPTLKDKILDIKTPRLIQFNFSSNRFCRLRGKLAFEG